MIMVMHVTGVKAIGLMQGLLGQQRLPSHRSAVYWLQDADSMASGQRVTVAASKSSGHFSGIMP
jgi:hypothetical protein